MKLYHDPISTTSRAVSLFIRDQGIALDEEIISLFLEEHQSAGFGRLNPNRQVPVLADGDFVLTECAAIMKYIAERAGSPAYPRDLHARARINEAMDWFNTGFSYAFLFFVIYPRFLAAMQVFDPATKASLAAFGMERTARYLTVLDEHMLGRSPYVCGNEVSLADYLGAVYVAMGDLIDFDFAPWPNVAAWLSRMKARDGWEGAFAGINGYARAMQAGSRAAS
ncbi:MAG: glutathione S-transferase family protein [Parvibaculum sp.]